MTKKERQALIDSYGKAYLVSGAYCTPFWDTFLKLTEGFGAARSVQEVLKTLHDADAYCEAYQLIVSLFEIMFSNVPAQISKMGDDETMMKDFVYEFLEDTADILDENQQLAEGNFED